MLQKEVIEFQNCETRGGASFWIEEDVNLVDADLEKEIVLKLVPAQGLRFQLFLEDECLIIVPHLQQVVVEDGVVLLVFDLLVFVK